LSQKSPTMFSIEGHVGEVLFHHIINEVFFLLVKLDPI